MGTIVEPDSPVTPRANAVHLRHVPSHQSTGRQYDCKLKPTTKLLDELAVRFVLTLHTLTLKEPLYLIGHHGLCAE
jgi:hypothetical protein